MFPQFLSLIFDCSMFISGRFGRIEHEDQHSRLNHSCCCRHSCCCLDQHSRLNHSCPMVSREKIQYHLILFWIFMSICILVVYAYYLGLLCKFISSSPSLCKVEPISLSTKQSALSLSAFPQRFFPRGLLYLSGFEMKGLDARSVLLSKDFS